MEDLCLLPAVELSRRLRTRELSARELLEASLARRDEVDGVVNAIVTRDDEGARRRAAELDDAIVRTGPVGPLHGRRRRHRHGRTVPGQRVAVARSAVESCAPPARPTAGMGSCPGHQV